MACLQRRRRWEVCIAGQCCVVQPAEAVQHAEACRSSSGERGTCARLPACCLALCRLLESAPPPPHHLCCFCCVCCCCACSRHRPAALPAPAPGHLGACLQTLLATGHMEELMDRVFTRYQVGGCGAVCVWVWKEVEVLVRMRRRHAATAPHTRRQQPPHAPACTHAMPLPCLPHRTTSAARIW